MTPKTAEKLAVRLASSGIAAGAIASRHIAMLCGYPNSIGLDMGGHEHRHLARLPGPGADHEGVVRRVRLPDLLPVDRGADDRRRRRLAGLDRRGRLAAQRPAVGRRRTPGPPATSAATTRPTNTDANVVLGRLGAELIGGAMTLDAGAAERVARGARRARSASGTLDGREGGHPGREREHGRHRPPDLDPPRLRPARVRARRVRRRGRAARRRPRARAVDPDRDRAAQPGHHLGARLPARRRPPRHHRDVPRARSRRSIRPRSRPSSSKLEDEARERLAAEDVPPEQMSLAAADRHALPRPVALARRCPSRRRSTSSRRPRRSTPSTCASTTSAATTRRSRSTGSNVKAIGVTPKAELARHEPTGATPSPRTRRPRDVLRRRTAPSDTPVYVRDDLPAGFAFDGPGDRRAVRLHRRRPAGLARRGRRVAEHPTARPGGSAMSTTSRPPLHASTRSPSRCSRTPSRTPSTRWRSRSCAPATRS